MSLGTITADMVKKVQEKFKLASREEAEKVLAIKSELDLIEKCVWSSNRSFDQEEWNWRNPAAKSQFWFKTGPLKLVISMFR